MKGFFVVSFHHFVNIKKAISINNFFNNLLKIYIFNFKIHILSFKNDIILLWVLGLVIKI